jgi:hypothetical protein
MKKTALLLALAVAATPGVASASAQATFEIVNTNAPGVGFNDPTPATPVGGNPGTTVGEQRLNAFRYAASIWGASLASPVTIRIQSSFVPLTCTPTSATLGSAGTIQIISDFGGYDWAAPGAEFPNTWYHLALANKRAGVDLIPGDPNTSADDIRARFNSNLGQPNCLPTTTWYYGFDTNHASNQINLVTVLLHEFAHGLGFSQFGGSNGSLILDQFDVYNRRLLDLTANAHWTELTAAGRAASYINPRRVVFDGPNVTAAVPSVLQPGTPLLTVNMPLAIAGAYAVGAAAFGAPLVSPGITGQVALALDASNASGPSTTDGCTALTNAAEVSGKIAILDRGTCAFVVKVKNAQDAGAIAVLVADNVAGGPPAGLGGADPTITIPSVRITLADGNTIKAQLAAGVNATLGVDLSVRAGADPLGRALIYTPNPVVPGSSVSHWDTSATPNQLMEPAINLDLSLSVQPPRDLSLPLMRDVGWFADADLDGVDDASDTCASSELSRTIHFGANDSGVTSLIFTNGCTQQDYYNRCLADADTHGDLASCVAHTSNVFSGAGFLEPPQQGKVQSAAARYKP